MRFITWLCVTVICLSFTPVYGSGLNDMLKKAKKEAEKKVEQAKKSAEELKKEADEKAKQVQKKATQMAKDAPEKAAQLQKDAAKTASQLQKTTAEKAAEAQKSINKLVQDASKKQVPVVTKTTTVTQESTSSLQDGVAATEAEAEGAVAGLDLFVTGIALQSSEQMRTGTLISETADSIIFFDSELEQTILHKKKEAFSYQRVYYNLAGEEQLTDDGSEPAVDCSLCTMVRKVLTEGDKSTWADNLEGLKAASGEKCFNYALSRIQIQKGPSTVRTLDMFASSMPILAEALSKGWQLVGVEEAEAAQPDENPAEIKPIDTSAKFKKKSQGEAAAKAVSDDLTKKLLELQQKMKDKQKK